MPRVNHGIKIIPFLLILLLSTGTNAAPTTSWGVDIGDQAIYWLEDLRFSQTGEANLATLLLDDANRTSVAIMTTMGPGSINYTLGLQNGSNFTPEQKVSFTETSLQGTTLILPNGSLPIVLPLSAGEKNNYLQYLASTAEASSFLISSFLQGSNITNFEDVSISGLYLTDFFNLTIGATVKDLEALSSQFLGLNITDQIGFGENQTINDIDFTMQSAFNSSDGMLAQLDLDAAINTTQTLNDGSNVTQVSTLNTTIIRKSFIPLEPNFDTSIFSSDQISSTSSIINEGPVVLIGVLPALFILSRRRN